jgi:hypothetical protein
MMDITVPPLCPVCGGKTRLKEMHRASRSGRVTCFFRCVDCDTEYPRSFDAGDSHLAGLTPQPKPEESPRDPAK